MIGLMPRTDEFYTFKKERPSCDDRHASEYWNIKKLQSWLDTVDSNTVDFFANFVIPQKSNWVDFFSRGHSIFKKFMESVWKILWFFFASLMTFSGDLDLWRRGYKLVTGLPKVLTGWPNL